MFEVVYMTLECKAADTRLELSCLCKFRSLRSRTSKPWFEVRDYTCIAFNIAVLNISEHRFDDLFQTYLEHDENCRSFSEVRSAVLGSPQT